MAEPVTDPAADVAEVPDPDEPSPSPMWRYGFVGALAGYLVGVVLAVPIAALLHGEATTTTEHRADLWGFAFAGGVLVAIVGAVLGVLRARSGSSPGGGAA